jgi:hypothetical protein
MVTQGTQVTRLKSDGRTIQSIFGLVITAPIIEQAATQASSFLSPLPHIWYLDFGRVSGFGDGMTQVFRQQFRKYREAGGSQVVARVPETIRGYKILCTALASAALNASLKLDLFETEADVMQHIITSSQM